MERLDLVVPGGVVRVRIRRSPGCGAISAQVVPGTGRSAVAVWLGHRPRLRAGYRGAKDREWDSLDVPWSMTARVPPSGDACRMVLSLLELDLELISDGDALDAAHHGALWAVEERLNLFAREVLAGVDPAAWAVARRFHRRARFHVYRCLMEDRSGRIAQLARACPGVLLLGAALESRFGEEELAAVTEAVVAGERLDRVIRMLAQLWFDLVVPENDPVHSAEGRAGEAIRAQMLRIRRAVATVDPDHLAALPPPAFAPEDIPGQAVANAIWFRAMAATSLALEGEDGNTPRALSSFISRHQRSVSRILRAQTGRGTYLASVQDTVMRLNQYLTATGRSPRRSSEPRRLIDACDRWFERSRPADHLENAQLAPWPHPDPRIPDLEMRPLRTAAELELEGRRMHHCADVLLEDAAAGKVWVFAVRNAKARLTAAIEPAPQGGYIVRDVRGRWNRPATEREREAVACWLAAVNEGLAG